MKVLPSASCAIPLHLPGNVSLRPGLKRANNFWKMIFTDFLIVAHPTITLNNAAAVICVGSEDRPTQDGRPIPPSAHVQEHVVFSGPHRKADRLSCIDCCTVLTLNTVQHTKSRT